MSTLDLKRDFPNYSLLIILFLSANIKSTQTITGNFINDFGLILGAGLYEEVIFRLVSGGVIFFLLNKLTNLKFISFLIAIFVSSFFFAASHFPEMNMIFTEFDFFVVRFISGCILSLIFLIRSLGHSILTHIFYNLLVIALF